MMNVKVVSREIIKPFNPTPEHLRFHPASLFDQANPPILMPLVFFFSPDQNNNITPITKDVVLDRLKGSLPAVLSIFYPLAGRFKDTKDNILCNDEGVPYVEAKAIGICLKDVIHKVEATQLDLLLPLEGQEGYTSLLLAIQVTTFGCDGVAIGVKINHVIGDAVSFLMFIKTWTSIANGKEDFYTPLPRHCFEIWKVFPPIPTKEPLDLGPVELQLIKPMTKRILFSQAKLSALRSELYAREKIDSINNKLPSLAMVLSALIWSRFKVACHSGITINNGNNDIPHEVFHAVNIRPKLVSNSPRQSYYFGNMVVNALAKPPVPLIDKYKNNYYYLCRGFLDQMEESIKNILAPDGFIRNMQEGKQNLEFMLEHFKREERGEIISLGFSNLRSLPIYEADFGWGKPVWVTSATQVATGMVMLMPAGPSSNDIEAYINLTQEDITKLEGDSELLSFAVMPPSATSKL